MRKFSDYLLAISQVNNLANNIENGQQVQWLFHCGMLLSSTDKWWGDFGCRHSAHEGIDITYFRTCNDEIKNFNSSIKIPAMDDGIVLNICNDFLGTTLVVDHKTLSLFNRPVLFVYSHINFESYIKPGCAIKKNDIIAKVCPANKNPLLPPHLHFSCFEVFKTVPKKDLNWDLFSSMSKVNMINPVFL
jgi:hypothetical protein